MLEGKAVRARGRCGGGPCAWILCRAPAWWNQICTTSV